MKKQFQGKNFYGSTTIGGKGQVVIPLEARKALDLAKGENLLVFGRGHDMVALAKIGHMQKFAEELEQHLLDIKKIINKAK